MKKIKIFMALFAIPFLMVAQTQAPATTDPDEEETEDFTVEEGDEYDENDEKVRQNPFIIDDDDTDIIIPDFVKNGSNNIIMNGADWSKLLNKLKDIDTSTFSIVHIGDSHVQADINTAVTRDFLQYEYGDAGRGLITPLKLSGTNEPSGYTFSSSRSWNAQKLMKTPWNRTMGFTGTSISPGDRNSSITLGTSTTDDYNPFSSVVLFHKGKMTIDKVTDADGNNIAFKAIPSRDYTHILLSQPLTKVTIDFSSNGDLTLFGADLVGNRPGLFYHAIGNNGATYEIYNRIGNVGEGLRPLNPNLVIIALGGNEAFGRLDTRSFYKSIDKLVTNIKKSNPDAEILLVTPMECHKSVYTTKSKKVKVPAKGRKGKKGRRKSNRNMVTKTVQTRVKSYAVNSNVLPLRNEILRYGKDNNIAVYDWYEIAGGDGASNTWINNGYYSSDRVHHTAKGYHLQGRLLYEALMKEFAKAK